MKKAFTIILILLSWGSCARAVERIPIVILPPQNLTGDTNLAHWHYSIPFFLGSQIGKEKHIRILPDSSIDFAFKELKLQPDQNLEPDQVRKLGQTIEARQVLFGSYQRTNGEWNLTMQLINAGTGKVSKPLTASSPELFQAVSEIRKRVLHQLGITPTEEERQQMDLPLTSSAEALEYLSLAYAYTKRGISLSNMASNLQQAVSLDHQFAMAQQALAHVLLLQGKTDEALYLAKQAITNRLDYAEAHITLGIIYLSKDLRSLAEEEFLEAIRLDPDDADPYSRLAEVYFRQRKLEESVSYLTKAEVLSPYAPFIHAQLGNIYLYLAKHDKALAELKLATHYNVDVDPGVDESLAISYQVLNETTKAVEHYEKFLTRAKEMGIQPSLLEQHEAALKYLKASLTPNYVAASIPQAFTSSELEQVLDEKLTPEEHKLVVIPFASSPEIDKWADELAGDGKEDMEKAQRLFNGLTRHINLHKEAGGRTAVTAFKDWSNPNAGITCQDYTFLYMAMARHLGLKAYYVLVAKDFSGGYVNHACVGIFINGKALLVDPAYVWFGVPHKEYEFEDDLRVVGFYTIARNNYSVGLKLIPDWAYPHFLFAVSQVYRGQLKEAREALDAGLKYDSTSWWALYAQAILEWTDKKWDAVAKHLQQCLILNPDYPETHYALGTTFQAQGKLQEARDEYQTYLRQDDYPEFADKAREAIAAISETLSNTSQNSQSVLVGTKISATPSEWVISALHST